MIFFTGPDYDEMLREEFPEVSYQAFDGFTIRQVACLVHKELPALSIRTYHPSALRRLRLWPILDKISARVASEA